MIFVSFQPMLSQFPCGKNWTIAAVYGTDTMCKPKIQPAESHMEKYVIGLFMRVFLMASSACNNITFLLVFSTISSM